MKLCAVCSKRLNLFNTRKDICLKDGEEICLSCSKKLEISVLNNIGNLTKEELVNIVLTTDKINGYCCICHRRLTMLNTSIANRISSGERICYECFGKLDNVAILDLRKHSKEDIINELKEQEVKKHIKEQEIKVRQQEIKVKRNITIEYKRTCNQCGKTWHVLAEREKYLEKEKKWNDCNMCVSSFSIASGNSYSWGAWTQSKHNEHTLDNEINRLKQCPNCMSSDYSEKQIRYER